MSTPSLDTLLLHQQIERIQASDRSAQEELVRAIGDRMERLARAMLRGYPGVQHRADTDDVFQSAMMRLLATLRQIRPASTADFYNLAAAHVRRELLDLARYFGRRRAELPEELPDGALEPTPERLELWARLHEAIAALPVEERETVSLAYYHGWTHGQIAEVLGVTDRSVRRYWRSACERLSQALGDDVDELLA